MDDLQLIENENQNNLPNYPIDEIPELNELDYIFIYLNLVPTSIYSFLIGLILIFSEMNNDKEYWSQAHHIILYLKLMLIIYLLYIIKGIFYYFIMTKNKIKNIYPKLFVEILYLLLEISYYIFTIAGKKTYDKLSLDFIANNIYKSIFIYSLLFIGFTYIFLFFAHIIYLVLSYIFYLMDFLNDETAFLRNHPGSFKILLSFLHEQKADLEHTGVCSICLLDIDLGDNIIVLNCSNKHFFHTDCIKKWLDYSSCCPLCKSSDL